MVVVTPGPGEVEEFCTGVPLAREVYDVLVGVVDGLGGTGGPPVAVTVSKSQIAFRRRTAFAWIWLPGRYLARPAAPVVVSIALARRDPGPRWKEVVQVGGGRWMHHLEVHAVGEVDPAVDARLAALVAEAYDGAG